MGTTNSSISFFRDGTVTVIPNQLGDLMTPSVVAYNRSTGRLEVGQVAKELLIASPNDAVAKFKRSMGLPDTFTLNNKKYTPVDLSSFVLMSLKRDAELYLEEPINRCVISVPAYFSENQRVATKQAAEMAGFSVERVLNEPTAAAIAHGITNLEDELQFLVFDLGGGTFDVCVMELFAGSLEVCSVAGESQLGGEDFTATLLEHVLNTEGLTADNVQSKDINAYYQLYRRVELAKRKLSHEENALITIPPIKKSNSDNIQVLVKQSELPEIFRNLLSKLIGPCRSAIRGAKVAPSDINSVIFAGGATRMKCIEEFVMDVFDVTPIPAIDPDLVVSQGAAIQAAMYAQDKEVDDIVITDILSHSLGVEIARKIANRDKTGFFDPIIHRNTVIPVSRSEIYYPITNEQTRLLLRIYEGESRYSKDNRKIGEIDIGPLPKFPSDRSVEVRFTYDLNGILDVDATILSTGQKFSETLIRNKDLNEKEIEEARKRMEELKADPRDNPKYRELLIRADLLYRELPEEARETLNVYINSLETAIEERNTESMEIVYEWISEFCDSYEDGMRW